MARGTEDCLAPASGGLSLGRTSLAGQIGRLTMGGSDSSDWGAGRQPRQDLEDAGGGGQGRPPHRAPPHGDPPVRTRWAAEALEVAESWLRRQEMAGAAAPSRRHLTGEQPAAAPSSMPSGRFGWDESTTRWRPRPMACACRWRSRRRRWTHLTRSGWPWRRAAATSRANECTYTACTPLSAAIVVGRSWPSRPTRSSPWQRQGPSR